MKYIFKSNRIFIKLIQYQIIITNTFKTWPLPPALFVLGFVLSDSAAPMMTLTLMLPNIVHRHVDETLCTLASICDTTATNHY